MPSCAAAQPEWGQNGFGNSAGFNTVENIAYYMPTYFVYRNTSQGEWFNWTLQNRFSLCAASYSDAPTFGQTPGTNLTYSDSGMSGGAAEAQWVYLMTDPSFPSTDMTVSCPTAALLNQVDSSGAAYQKCPYIAHRLCEHNRYTCELLCDG